MPWKTPRKSTSEDRPCGAFSFACSRAATALLLPSGGAVPLAVTAGAGEGAAGGKGGGPATPTGKAQERHRVQTPPQTRERALYALNAGR